MPLLLGIFLAALFLRFLWWLKYAPKEDLNKVPDDSVDAKAWYDGGSGSGK